MEYLFEKRKDVRIYVDIYIYIYSARYTNRERQHLVLLYLALSLHSHRYMYIHIFSPYLPLFYLFFISPFPLSSTLLTPVEAAGCRCPDVTSVTVSFNARR